MTGIAPNAWAAPTVSVLLVLSVSVVALFSATTGLPVAVAGYAPYPPGVLCIETRYVIVRIDAHRRVFINTEPVTLAALPDRLEEIFRTRAERIAYVTGEPEVTFGDVAGIVDVVRGVVPRIGLLATSREPGYSGIIDARFGGGFGNQLVLRSQ